MPRLAPAGWPLRGVAAAILVFNLVDGVLTLAVVEAGLATEANPLMAGPLDHSPVTFMTLKLALVSLGVYLLWQLRRRRSALMALEGLAAVYAALMLYHLQSVEVLAGYLR